MPRFFVENINSDKAFITGDDARHIGRSLRMRLGDELIVCCDGVEYTTTIDTISDSEVVCSVISSERSKAEPGLSITLYQAMPKGDKLELIIQKCVELGVCRIVPVLTSRCVSRPDSKSFEKKLARYNKIAEEAAKQSGRGIIPEISGIMSFDKAISDAKALDGAIVCYENGSKPVDKDTVASKKSIGVFVGAEGGFSEDEIAKLEENRISAVWLGQRILRCETAPMAITSILLHESLDM